MNGQTHIKKIFTFITSRTGNLQLCAKRKTDTGWVTTESSA